MSHRLLWIALLVTAIPAISAATTADDLSSRIAIDGRLDEYHSDEWVLDAIGEHRERVGDSAWGSDNDVGRVAVTWDRRFLYVGIECVTVDSRLFLLVDHAAGGAADMQALGELRRAIVFSGAPALFRPDLVIEARPESVEPRSWRIADGVADQLAPDAVTARYAHRGRGGGALEVAIPWSRVASSGGVLSIMAAITGATGSGCGDAAPDPHGALSSLRTDVSYLDRPLVIEFDAGGDGIPDPGVSPRDAAAVEGGPSAVAGDGTTLNIFLGDRSFAPDDGESATFTIRGEGPDADRAFVSARVYSRRGELVRVLFEDELRVLADPTEDVWDGTDRFGRVVPGGIYILNVSWGAARGARAGTVNAAVAVVR